MRKLTCGSLLSEASKLFPCELNSWIFSALALLTALVLSPVAEAVTPLAPYLTASQTSIPTVTSLNYPYRVAIDSHGAVYISDTQNNRVLKEVVTNGVPTETIVQSGLSTPYGVAVDTNGVVYIVDNGNVRIVKDVPNGSGGYTESVVTTSALSYPTGIAVDLNGNLYITDTGHGRIVKEAVNGASYTESIVSSSGLPQITGITVDASGNVFVSDIDAQAIFEETYSAGNYTQSTVPTSGLNYPYDVTVDVNDNLYITDFANDRILKETYSAGSYTQTTFPTANLTGPLGVATDLAGDLFIADTFGFEIKKLSLSHADFGSANVASSKGPIYDLFQFSGGLVGDSVSMGPYAILTQGAANQDYADAGSSSCTSATYHSGDFCSVSVDFSPAYPGGRQGAVQLLDASASPNVLLTTALSGIGVGPQINFLPGNPSYVAGSVAPYSLSNPFGAVADTLGNVYIVDYNNNAAYKETLAGGAYTQSTIVTGLNNPEDIAVDGAGNVYVVDSGNNRVLKESFSGGVYVQSTVAVGLDFPTGIAVDGSQNVYVSSFGDGAVYLETSNSNGTYSQSTVVSGLNEPRKIAVDAFGNVYIANTGASNVLKETYTGSGYAQSIIGSGMLYPYGVAVEPSGSVWVADTVNHRLLLETYAAGSYTQFTVYPGATLYGVSLGKDGSLYVPDASTAAVYVLSYTSAPSLSFASTNLGATSSDSPQAVELINEGNAGLTFAVPGTGTNAAITLNFGLDNSTTCPQVSSSGPAGVVAAGALCNYEVNFSPTQPGADPGTLTLTDNTLNVPASTQVVNLNGTGVAPDTTSTAVMVTPPSVQVGQPVAITATVTDTTAGHGATVPTGSVTFTDTVNTTTVSLNGGNPVPLVNGVASLSGVVLSGLGSHTITANYGGVTSYFVVSSNTGGVSVIQLPQLAVAVTHTGPGTANAFEAGQSGTYSIAVSNSGPGSTGGATVTLTDVLPSGLTVTSANGLGWTCMTVVSSVTCTNSSTVAASSAFPVISIAVTPSFTAPVSVTNTASASGTGLLTGTGTDGPSTVLAEPSLTVANGHSPSSFTQESYGNLSIGVSNLGNGATSGTTTITDSLPGGETLISAAGAGWSCSGTTSVTCASSQVVAANGSFTLLTLTVAVPYGAPASTTNQAFGYGGGDVQHNNAGSAASGSTDIIAVNALHLVITAPSTATAGVPINYTVTAEDPSNNVVSTYFGTVHFTSGDPQAVLPANTTLTNGTGTFPATLKTSGNQTLNSTDTVNAAVTATTSAITVSAGAAARFTVNAPGTATVAASFNFTVTAFDAFNNVATGYAGVAHFSATDPLAILPANATLVNGAGTFSTTLKSAGSQTLTATDTVTAGVTGTSVTILVAKATAPITLSNLSQVYTGSPLSASASTVPSGLTVTFTYNGSSTAPTTTGTYPLVATIVDPNYQGTTSGTFTIMQGTAVLAFAPASPIGYSTSLSTLLNATGSFKSSPLPGTFTYTATLSGGPAVSVTASTVLAVGSYTLTATFTPTDMVDFPIATTTAALTVSPVVLSFSANGTTRAYGTANPTFTGSVNGAVNNDTFTESFATTAVTLSPVGSYNIVPSVTGVDLAASAAPSPFSCCSSLEPSASLV